MVYPFAALFLMPIGGLYQPKSRAKPYIGLCNFCMGSDKSALAELVAHPYIMDTNYKKG